MELLTYSACAESWSRRGDNYFADRKSWRLEKKKDVVSFRFSDYENSRHYAEPLKNTGTVLFFSTWQKIVFFVFFCPPL